MDGPEIGITLLSIRRKRMWTQSRLAEEAGVSPTTISSIEGGRISRPHFGTVRKLAAALGVSPEDVVGPTGPVERRRRVSSVPLSLEWAISAREEEFERELEAASLETLSSLSKELSDEHGRLQKLYGEFPPGSEQQRFIKRRIRNVAAQSGSVNTSITFYLGRGSAGEGERAGQTARRRRGGSS